MAENFDVNTIFISNLAVLLFKQQFMETTN